MNIKITHNWLLEYLETDANPFEIQKYLSLCGPSIERITKIDADYVYDIEITTNRVDMASVLGIAQEAQAILPQFGKKAKLKFNPLEKYNFAVLDRLEDYSSSDPPAGGESRSNKKLNIEIKSKKLCSRFTAIVLDNVKIGPSPNFIGDRLKLCDIKSINNVVDISNYLMISLGQPVHVFDYDSIGRDVINHVSTMKMRESRKSEKIITLDGKQITLPGGDIVIEDGNAKLVDLCGIMGGFNSAVNPKTNKVILFVQTYSPQKIRRTSMLTGQRTVAATFFEKGLDEERVEPTTVYGTELLKKYARAKVASKIYDIYPSPYKSKTISVSIDDIQKVIGVPITQSKIISILSNLGFSNLSDNGRAKWVTFSIPSYRSRDVSIKQDLVEEIARIYGYHNLPNNIQPTVYIKQPKEIELLFELQSKIKRFLKHLGLNEVMNYSMVSKDMILNSGLKINDHLAIKNSISEEIKFMRTHIFPSLLMNIKKNEGKKDVLKLFEIAKIYQKKTSDLPEESYRLGIVVNTSYSDLKGIIDSLFMELNIDDFTTKKSDHFFLEKKIQGEIIKDQDWIIKFGEIAKKIKLNYNLKSNIFVALFNLKALIKYQRQLSQYKPINPFAIIKLDKTFQLSPNYNFEVLSKAAYQSKLLQKLEVISLFKNKLTVRFYFSAKDRNITEEEAKKELQIVKELASK